MSAEVEKFNRGDFQADPFSSCGNLREVIGQIEGRARGRGRVVCGISVNGMRLSEQDELRLANTELKDIEFIEVETEDPAHLVRSTLDSQLALINEIERVGLACAEAFRRPDLSQAEALLLSLLDGCRWLTDSLMALRGAESWWASSETDLSQWNEAENDFRRVTKEVLGAVETKDLILLADLLEYDLANSLGRWRDQIKILQEKCPQG